MKVKNLVVKRNDNISILDFYEIEEFKNYKSVLVQVFSAVEDKDFLQLYLNKLKSFIPKAKIIGTSCSEFINNKIEDNGILFSIIGFEKSEVNIFLENDKNLNSYEIGKSIAKKLSSKTEILITFSESKSINGDLYLDGIKAVRDNIHIAGGIASTKSFKNTFVIYDTQILYNGVVAAEFFGENLKFYNDYLLGWEHFGKEFTVTSADGKNLIAIDGKSPKKIFEHYLGKEVADHIPGVGSAFSFIIKRGEDFIPRGIIDVKDEKFVLAGEIKVGDKIYLAYANPYSIINQKNFSKNFCEKIGKPEVIFNYYCLGRKLYLPQEVINHEMQAINRYAPVSGFLTLGEFFATDSQCINLNFSTSIIALSEGEKNDCKEKNFHIEIPDFNIFNLITQGLFRMIETRSKELEELAYYDQLTNLPNRRYLNEKIIKDIKFCKEKGKKLAVLYIDLDKFKNINDTLGHFYGDEILKKVGKELKEIAFKNEAFIARFGGDEFIMLIKIDNHHFEKVIKTINSIIDFCKKPINIKNKTFTLGTSVGVSLYPNDGIDVQDLIKNADIAMYQAKLKGGNRFKFYNEYMTKNRVDIIKLENDLREAIKNNQFVVYYQPIYNILNKKIIGAEALIRWKHPKKGIIYPEQFIEFAEQEGYIDNITEKVLEKVFNDLNILKMKKKNLPKININFSVKNILNDRFVKKIEEFSKKYQISPKYISIEVTETSLVKNIDKCVKTLKKLKDLGIDISIDDFGTGYSSLNYLKTLPITSLKIDKSFISEIPYEKNDIVIVETILALADALNLNVVAEGIETKEQEEFLIKSKSYSGQGYLYKRPMRFNEFEKIL
ncbi:bifunctional diguanylate cyclase/phosphodiesterase [Nitrosophilus kaiyonis]|uniref:bifunctional diguanylate cyclase/phosphodiesterase n=1 Tax=Nitrosophilus kaiyonis TaxID=2930200 RepID=UPI002490D601|nr:EAL domain-containing protein [Nitrosophilus kaiyonis]